jgi:hypothetical protein
MAGGMLMACLRLNGYTLNLDQAQLFDLHGQAVELRPQALAVLNWGAGTESWLQSSI